MAFWAAIGQFFVTAAQRTAADFTAARTVGARTVATHLATNLGQSVTQSVLSPGTREINYHINNVFSNVTPDPPAILSAYYSGRLTERQTRTLLGYQGIDWQFAAGDGEGSFTVQAWKAIVELSRPALDISTYADLYHQGRVTWAKYDERLRKEGLIGPERSLLLEQEATLDIAAGLRFYQQALLTAEQFTDILKRNGLGQNNIHVPFLTQKQPIDVASAVNQYWLGAFTEEQAAYHLRLSGYGKREEYAQVINLETPFASVEALMGFWRGNMTRDEMFRNLQANGIVDGNRAQRWIDSQRFIPAPADLVSFAVREAWDNNVAARFGYDEEFPEAFRFWMAKQGADWGEPTPLVAGGPPVQITWPQAYWRSHWQLMSPTQAYDAFHRLRPGRAQRFAAEVAGIRDFTAADLSLLLKTADYPPAFRQWLTALAYTPLRLFDIRATYVNRLANRQWAIDQLRDRGYHVDDAEAAVDLWDHLRNEQSLRGVRALENAASGQLAKEILEGYSDGLIDAADARRRLNRVGMRPQFIENVLQTIASRQRRKYLRGLIRELERDYTTGLMTAAEVMLGLTQLGVQQAAAQSYLQLWGMHRSTRRRMATSGQILGWVKQGLLSPADGLARLLNLGWYNPDALIAVQSASNALSVARGRAVLAGQTAANRRAAKLQAAIKAQKAAVKQAQADLRRLSPLATLKKWLADGVITEAYALARLRAQGYTEEVAEKYLVDWRVQREHAAEKAAKPKGAKGGSKPPASGGGQPPQAM